MPREKAQYGRYRSLSSPTLMSYAIILNRFIVAALVGF